MIIFTSIYIRYTFSIRSNALVLFWLVVLARIWWRIIREIVIRCTYDKNSATGSFTHLVDFYNCHKICFTSCFYKRQCKSIYNETLWLNDMSFCFFENIILGFLTISMYIFTLSIYDDNQISKKISCLRYIYSSANLYKHLQQICYISSTP